MSEKKPRRRFGLLDAVQLVLVAVILVSGFMLAKELLAYRQGTSTYDEAAQTYTAPQPTPAGTPLPDATPAPTLGFTLLDVDFAALQAKNPDVVAWLDFDALDISYPVVHGAANDTYLYTMWDGRANKAGSIFLEADNIAVTDLHAILYGHNMKNGSMFGQLKQYQKADFWQENGGGFTLYLPDGMVCRYEIFAAKIIAANSDLYTVGFEYGKNYEKFLQNAAKRPLYDTGITLLPEDKVMTLSTCTYSDENRFVVCARLADTYTPAELELFR